MPFNLLAFVNTQRLQVKFAQHEIDFFPKLAVHHGR